MRGASRTFLAVSGAYLLLTGVAGFAVSGSFPVSSEAVDASHGHIFGVLETNGWHNLAALALAVPSLLVALRRPRWSPTVALASGFANTAVFVLFAVWGGATFLVASNDADQVVHAATALGGLLCGAWDLRVDSHEPRTRGAGS